MRKLIETFDADAFCKCYKIKRNKHGVFFINNAVMMFDWLKSTIYKDLVPSGYILTDGEFREIVSRLDIYAEETKQGSKFFRKGKTKYGIYTRKDT